MSLPGFLKMCAILVPLTLFAMATHEAHPTLCYAVQVGVITFFLFHPRGPYVAVMGVVLKLGYCLFLWVAIRLLPRRLFNVVVRLIGIDIREISR